MPKLRRCYGGQKADPETGEKPALSTGTKRGYGKILKRYASISWLADASSPGSKQHNNVGVLSDLISQFSERSGPSYRQR
jgi:hypothetical protein